MIAGHYATALVAKDYVPSVHIAYYLAASQLPDLAWYSLAVVGMAPLHSHAGPVALEMVISHDLLPTLGWIGVAVATGRAVFGAWRPAAMGGLLVALHLVADLLAGYPHHILGPDTPLVGTGLYFSAPYLAVAAEGLFAAGLIGWIGVRDWQTGVRRSAWTWGTWALLFGGGIGSTFVVAPLLAEFNPNEPLDALAIAGLLGTYGTQMALLTWAHGRPLSREAAGVAS